MRQSFPRRFTSMALVAVLALSNLLTAAASSAQEPVAAPAGPATAAQPATPPARPAPYRPRRPLPQTAAAAAPVAATPVPVVSPGRPGARLAPGTPIPAAELEAFIDGYVARAMAADHIAGVTVSVVQDGLVVFKKGYGYASLTPLRRVNPDTTLFRIGSISKTFTWIAVLKEIEAGRMRLDGPVNLYLPEALRIPDQGMTRPILVRDLMNHMPGFEDRALGHLFERDFNRERPLALYLQQERPSRVREPGVLPSYSNYGAALAGEAASYVSGRPFEALIETGITLPLGMTRTTFRELHPPKAGMPAPMSAALAADVSRPFHWSAAGYQARDYEFIGHIGPAGAASSTAGDMARYMLLLLGGGAVDGVAVYGPATAQALATPSARAVGQPTGFNHGLAQVQLPAGFSGLGHDGATMFFMSSMVVVPELRLGVFSSANTDTGGGLVNGLPAAIVEHFYGAPPAPRPGSPELKAAAGAYEGDFLASRRAYGGLEGFVTSLIGIIRVSVTDDGHLMIGPARLSPLGDLALGRFISETGAGVVGVTLQDGKVQRIFLPGGAMVLERIGFFHQTGLLITLTVFAMLAALATLVGLVFRNRRDTRETTTQARASLLQTIQAVLWFLAVGGLGLFAAGAEDRASVVFSWPAPTILVASACALVAAVLTLVTLGMAPFVWRGGRRVDSWTFGRKARFTLTATVYFAFSIVLMIWGALEPWSG